MAITSESGNFLRDPVITEFLMAQLHLTSYEAMAFTSVILGNEQATAIAESAGIPRSKVYGSLESLVQKGLISKKEKGDYQPVPGAVTNLKDQADILVKKYIQFVDNLHAYAVGPSRFASKIKAEITSLFGKNGFTVRSPPKNETDDVRLEEYIMRTRYSNRRVGHEGDFVINSSQDLKKIISLGKEYLDFVGESTTSGIKVGVSVLTESKTQLQVNQTANLVTMVCGAFNCQGAILIPSPEVAPSYSQKLEEIFTKNKSTSSFNVKLIFTGENFEREINSYLGNMEKYWREQKYKIIEIEDTKDKTKMNIRTNIVKIEDLNKQSDIIPEEYREVYQDIFLRIKRDLQTYESLALSLEERISLWYRLMDSKMILDSESISQSGKELREIEAQVIEKGNELASFEEELYSLPTGTNLYKKFGFLVNPFSLTVPMLKPDAIINQTKQKEQMDQFLGNLLEGSENNLSFVVAKEGGGKTHFLNFYRSRINKNDYGIAFAIRIQCRPNRDLLDLYPQITTEIRRIAGEKKDEKVSAGLEEALAEAGTPRVISDLMKILRSLAMRISNAGYGPLFILIDEFENALPRSIQGRRQGYINESPELNPQALTQLDSLTQLGGIGFIVVFRREMWDFWHRSVEKKVIKYDKSLVIELSDLSLANTAELITHRLTGKQFRRLSSDLDPPTFDENLIKTIFEKTQGNPRNILRIANRAFRRAVTKNAKSVTIEHIDTL